MSGAEVRLPDIAAAEIGVRVRRAVPLAPYTSLKVGGPAEYFATVTTVEQLVALVRWAQAAALPYFILGGGSNILVSDAGVRGLVIHNRCRQVRLEHPAEWEFGHVRLVAESGAAMAGVARQSLRDGLAGLEWAVSVPGTVGGAVVGNAGAHGGEIKDSLASATILDGKGELREVCRSEMAYAYRDSALKRLKPLAAGFHPVVVRAGFVLAYGDAEAIRARAEGYLAHRRRTQPVEPSVGSTFVNPPGDFAGRLIEAAGLKGVAVEGVEVSTLHANFIINRGGVGAATAADMMRLIELIQTTVRQRFGVELELEVQRAGEW